MEQIGYYFKMKNYLIGAGIIVVAVGLFLGGYVVAPKTSPNLGSYVPPVQSAGGFTVTLSTSTAYTLACTPTNIDWLNTTAVATATFSAATTTFAACPQLNNLGSSVGGLIVNDSTNTVNYASGTGVKFQCETNGVGTSTVSGLCTASAFSILASTTVQYTALFDGASTTLLINVGNNFH